MWVEKLVSLYWRKEILPLHLLKNPSDILVLLPLDEYKPEIFVTPLGLLRNKFNNAQITGVISVKDIGFFEPSGLFDQIIQYKSRPLFLSRQFFRLRKKLRSLKSQLSIDFNSRYDLLSWLGGATMRVGIQRAPFINCRVKLSETRNETDNANRLVDVICSF